MTLELIGEPAAAVMNDGSPTLSVATSTAIGWLVAIKLQAAKEPHLLAFLPMTVNESGQGQIKRAELSDQIGLDAAGLVREVT